MIKIFEKNNIIISVKTKKIDHFLKKLYKLNIEILNLYKKSYNEIIFEINEKDIPKIKKLTLFNRIEIKGYNGIKNRINIIEKNKVLFFSIIFGIIFLNFLSNIVFDININHTSNDVKTYMIDELKKYGIKRLSIKKSFDELNEIKEKILNENKDKLEWIEIVEDGTKYIVNVEERKINNYVSDYKYQNIVANNDATIVKILAENGEVVKKINEQVKKGDTIISGEIYLNDKLMGKVKANGTIYGEVWYNLTIEYPIIDAYKEETGNISEYYSINFLNFKFDLLKKESYKNSYINQNYILKNNIFPIGLSFNKEYELNIYSGIYTEGEAVINAKKYAKDKMLKMLDEDEYIIDDKVLKYSLNSNTIYMDVFFKVYKNITAVKEIIEE